MITIQIASDLHIEYRNDNVPNPLDYITPSADILILAGDIGSLYKIKQLTKFLEILCPLFHTVLYVPGNHEWYTIMGYEPLNWNTLKKRMHKIENNIPNLYILDKSSVRIGDVCITGATLWSKAEYQIPPFIVRVHGMNTQKYQNKHEEDLAYLKKMIKYCQKNNLTLLIVTHHPPTKKVLESTNKRNKFFYLYGTDLDYLLDKEKVNTWVCGHIHKNFDFITHKGCRVISNQKGKKKDKIMDYKKNFIITI